MSGRNFSAQFCQKTRRYVYENNSSSVQLGTYASFQSNPIYLSSPSLTLHFFLNSKIVPFFSVSLCNAESQQHINGLLFILIFCTPSIQYYHHSFLILNYRNISSFIHQSSFPFQSKTMDHEADAYKTDLMTITRFVLNEQSKHPESRGDFTILLSHILLGCKYVCSAVNKVRNLSFNFKPNQKSFWIDLV